MSNTSDLFGDLTQKNCKPCEGGVPPLTVPQINELLQQLPGWEYIGSTISKAYRFKTYFETIAFVNATAWVSHRENHHPDLQVNYNECRVIYTTHEIKGLSENDFICAAKLDALVAA